MKESTIRYSIVVPFYNEQENVRPLYERIAVVMDALGEPYEMIFVDDGSRDQTYRVLSEVFEHDPRVHVLRLHRNCGQTVALKAGFDFAQGEIIISMDGDLQHEPEEIPSFIEKMKEGYDIVSGWRVERKDAWLTRRLPSRIANWMMAKLARIDLHDFGTTFKAYRREVIQGIPLYGDLHRFIPALASWSGATIAEIPIRNVPRSAGKSNYGLTRTIRVLLDLITIKFLLDYSHRPAQFFGLIGLLATALGTISGFFLLFKKLVMHVAIMDVHGPLLFMTMVLILSGLQFISIGLIGELLARTYYESQNKRIYAVRDVKSRRPEASEFANRNAQSMRP